MKTKNIFFALLTCLFIFSCKQEKIETDNIYKFKEIINKKTGCNSAQNYEGKF